MNPQDAIHHVVHDFPGGAEALAPRIGRGAQVLRNKVTLSHDGARRSHEPTLADVSAISRVTGDLRVIEALAAENGAVVVRLPDMSGVADDALLDLLLTSSQEYGEACAALRDALADGEVDRVRGLVVDRPRVRAIAKAVR